MIKVSIKNLELYETHSSIHSNLQLAETWVTDNIQSFGNTSNIEYIDITAQFNYEKQAREAREYLVSTDWYVIRKTETGVNIPAEITLLRAEARLKI